MRDTFYKYMPGAFGLFLGWMLFNPPAWLEALGPLGLGLNLGVGALLLLSVVALIMITNLPAELRLEPIPDSVIPGELRTLAERMQGLGFDAAGPAWKVNVSPAATMLGFVHRSEPVYATAFRTNTMPAKTAFDFVSILEGDRGGLTTMAEPGGAALPEGPGGFRQVLPGGSPEQLFRSHLEGLRWLAERGARPRNVSAGDFQPDFTRAMARQRALVTAAPIRSTLIALWRAGTKKVPSMGALRDQPFAQRQIGRLQAG